MKKNVEIDPSKPLHNARHEAFAQLIFKGKGQIDAYREVFPNQAKTKDSSIATHACKLNAKIMPRLTFLQSQLAKATIMTKQEIGEMLTRICRTKHSDFLTMSADGVWFHNIGEETLNQEALKKVKTRIQTEKNGRGDSEVIVEKQFDEIELESKVTAGKALADLMGYNAPQKVDVTTDTLRAVLDEINAGGGTWYGPKRKKR